MSYEELWKVLNDLLTALQRKGEKIPAQVTTDMRSAKTLIEIVKVDPNKHENLPRIEKCLENVEFHLIFWHKTVSVRNTSVGRWRSLKEPTPKSMKKAERQHERSDMYDKIYSLAAVIGRRSLDEA